MTSLSRQFQAVGQLAEGLIRGNRAGRGARMNELVQNDAAEPDEQVGVAVAAFVAPVSSFSIGTR